MKRCKVKKEREKHAEKNWKRGRKEKNKEKLTEKDNEPLLPVLHQQRHYFLVLTMVSNLRAVFPLEQSPGSSGSSTHTSQEPCEDCYEAVVLSEQVSTAELPTLVLSYLSILPIGSKVLDNEV